MRYLGNNKGLDIYYVECDRHGILVRNADGKIIGRSTYIFNKIQSQLQRDMVITMVTSWDDMRINGFVDLIRELDVSLDNHNIIICK